MFVRIDVIIVLFLLPEFIIYLFSMQPYTYMYIMWSKKMAQTLAEHYFQTRNFTELHTALFQYFLFRISTFQASKTKIVEKLAA